MMIRLVLLLFVTQVTAATMLSEIKGNVTLTKTGSPYIVEKNLINTKSDTLTIEKGVVVKFRNYTKLFLRGHIRFLGSKREKIVLHSERPNTNWVGLYIHGSPSPIIMKNVVIMNSFKNSILNSEGKVSNLQCINNHYGLWIENTQNFTITQSQFSQNRYGLTVANANISVISSTIEENAFGTYMELNGAVTFKNTKILKNKMINSLDMNESPITNKRIAKSIWKSIEATF